MSQTLCVADAMSPNRTRCRMRARYGESSFTNHVIVILCAPSYQTSQLGKERKLDGCLDHGSSMVDSQR